MNAELREEMALTQDGTHHPSSESLALGPALHNVPTLPFDYLPLLHRTAQLWNLFCLFFSKDPILQISTPLPTPTSPNVSVPPRLFP